MIPLRIIVSCVIKCFLSIVGVHSRGSFKRICLFYLCHKVCVTDSSFQRMRTVQYLILRTYEKYGMFHNPKNKKKRNAVCLTARKKEKGAKIKKTVLCYRNLRKTWNFEWLSEHCASTQTSFPGSVCCGIGNGNYALIITEELCPTTEKGVMC